MILRKQETPWYHRCFGTDYLQLYPHRSAKEAAQTIRWLVGELGLQPPCRVLDMACGSGRHSAELIQRGFQTVGLDLSWPLLRAAARTAELGRLLRVRGDMRLLPLRSGRFDAVLSLFTSFGYFESKDEDLQVLHEVARALRPGGAFVLDFLNAPLVRRELVQREESSRDGRQVIIERWVDEAKKRVEKLITVRDRGGIERQYRESVSLYDEEDLGCMFEQAAIKPQRKFGDYLGAEYTDKSPRLILIGVRSV